MRSRSSQLRLLIGLMASFILHGVVIGGLWMRSSPEQTQEALDAGPIALDIKDGLSAGETSRLSEGPGQHVSQPLNLKDLRPARKFAPSDDSGSSGRVAEVHGGGVGGESSSSQWGMGMGLEQSMAANPFMSEVAGRVFEHLSYPEDFVRSRIWGQVKARIELDRRGVFVGRFINLESGSDLLAAHVGAILVSALKHPLHKKSWMPESTLYPVDLTFDFEIYSDDSARPKDQSFYFKNVIHAHVAAYAPPLLNQKIEEWMTHYVPPIIPLPGGVYVDFIRAYQYIKNLGEPSESESRERRLNLLKEQLNSTLQERKG